MQGRLLEDHELPRQSQRNARTRQPYEATWSAGKGIKQEKEEEG